MARPIWTGAITFGLVSVPVGMYSATHEHEVSFHQFEKDTADRIRYRRVNERTGKEVDYEGRQGDHGRRAGARADPSGRARPATRARRRVSAPSA